MAGFRNAFAATALALISPAAFAQAEDTSETREDVILIADSLFENAANNTVIAEGNVEASYEGRVLRADRVVYDRNTNKVRATGNVVILDADGTQRFADEVEVNSNLSDGYAIGFSVRLPNGGVAVANSAIRQEGGVNALDQVIYTSCEVCDEDDTPTWALRARRAVLDEEDQMISYRDAVLEIGGIPVIYLPFFAHPDPASERRSGLLFPDLGVSSKVGVFYQQPYFWAVSDHQDLVISPEVFQKVNPLLELDYSKRFWSGDLYINTSVTQEQLFDGDGERLEDSDESVRSHIYAKGLFALNNTWDWGFGVERASDDLYTRRYDIDGEGDLRGLYSAQSFRLISQLFAVGQSENFYSETSFIGFQGLRANDSNDTLPRVTPLHFTERLIDLGAYGHAAIQASTAAISRDEAADSARVSLGVDWSRETILPGGLVLDTFADARADYYSLDEDFSGESSVTRGVGSLGGTLSYPLIRRGESWDIIVEPIVMGAWGVANGNKAPIPVEDSLFFEADDTSLFESNASSGYDLYEGDGRVAAGIRTRARWENGVELSATAGRRWRSRSDPNFDTLSNLSGTSSDWVANTAIDFKGPLRLEAGVRLDEETYELNRIDARVRTSFWRFSGSANYFKLSDEITSSGTEQEAITIASQFQVTDRWSMVYARQREILTDFDRSHAIGIRYSDDCSIFTISYERKDSRDRELGPSESLNFRFTLKTLGDFGSQDVD